MSLSNDIIVTRRYARVAWLELPLAVDGDSVDAGVFPNLDSTGPTSKLAVDVLDSENAPFFHKRSSCHWGAPFDFVLMANCPLLPPYLKVKLGCRTLL